MGSGRDAAACGAAGGTPPAVDREQLDGLVSAAGVDGTREILAAFWRSTDALLASLKQQIAKGDFAAAARTAHSLKGSALNVGALGLSDAIRRVEERCRSKDWNGASESADGAHQRRAEAEAAYKTLLDRAA